MKIIAHSAGVASLNAQKVLEVANDVEVAELAASGALEGVDLVVLNFPKFTDGRAYTQAVLLHRRYRFKGSICATGDVLLDQLVHMHRSGFTHAVLAEGVNADAAQRQFDRFTAFYQGDVLEQRPLFARLAAELVVV